MAQNGVVTGGIWARQTRRDKVAVAALAIQLLVSVILVIAGLNQADGDTSLPGRFTLLAVNVVALFAVLQLAMGRLFDDQREVLEDVRADIAAVSSQLARTTSELESVTTFGEAYAKIVHQEEDVRLQFQSTLDGFLKRLSNCIDERRSGALDVMDYYGVLEDLADAIAADYASTSEASATEAEYPGGIWALSFILDDEWDDASAQEVRWFDRLASLDEQGIGTQRLWAFDRKMLASLNEDPIRQEGVELIRRLSLYCSDDTLFNNTKSLAVNKHVIQDEHVDLFGKGFFAGRFADGRLRLIRGVCFDNLLSSNSLGGEVDFDPQRIERIHQQWLRYMNLGRPLKEYLWDAGNQSARAAMTKEWGEWSHS